MARLKYVVNLYIPVGMSTKASFQRVWEYSCIIAYSMYVVPVSFWEIYR